MKMIRTKIIINIIDRAIEIGIITMMIK
jgi:hypothetical protein